DPSRVETWSVTRAYPEAREGLTIIVELAEDSVETARLRLTARGRPGLEGAAEGEVVVVAPGRPATFRVPVPAGTKGAAARLVWAMQPAGASGPPPEARVNVRGR